MPKINFSAVETIIREVAAEEIMPRYKNLQQSDINFKIGDDPVTIADKAAEIALSSRLKDLLPGSTVVGEEDFAVNPSVIERFSGESPVWIVDPIDGTRNFVAGKPVFGVIVALAERNQTIAGWLYDPTSKEFVSAEKGAGSYFNGQKLQVLAPNSIGNLTGSLGSRIIKAFAEANMPAGDQNPQFYRSMMSGCHEYARLTVDGPHFSRPDGPWHFRSTLEGCTPWDDAAGLLIHAEAGGYNAHWNGEPFSPSSYHRGLLIAPNKENWDELKRWVSSFCPLPE